MAVSALGKGNVVGSVQTLQADPLIDFHHQPQRGPWFGLSAGPCWSDLDGGKGWAPEIQQFDQEGNLLHSHSAEPRSSMAAQLPLPDLLSPPFIFVLPANNSHSHTVSNCPANLLWCLPILNAHCTSVYVSGAQCAAEVVAHRTRRIT